MGSRARREPVGQEVISPSHAHYSIEISMPAFDGYPWMAGLYEVTMEFTDDFPHKPPKCQFPKGFFHVNVYPSGTICLRCLA